jgi:hypothetical protein
MHGFSLLPDTASRACWKRRMSSAAGGGKDMDRDPVEVLTRYFFSGIFLPQRQQEKFLTSIWAHSRRWSVGNGPGGRPDAALARAAYWDSFYQHRNFPCRALILHLQSALCHLPRMIPDQSFIACIVRTADVNESEKDGRPKGEFDWYKLSLPTEPSSLHLVTTSLPPPALGMPQSFCSSNIEYQTLNQVHGRRTCPRGPVEAPQEHPRR